MEMDTFRPIKTRGKKTKVVTKKSRVQILSSLFFRAIEITVVVVTVAKLFYQLVIAFDNSGERFKGLAAILANRHFVFVAGNAIVIALLARHGRFPSRESDTRSTSDGFYEEFVRERRIEERSSYSCADTKNRGKQSTTEFNTKQSTTASRQRHGITKNEGVTENKKIQNATDTRQRPGTSENRQKQSVVEFESTTDIIRKQGIPENRSRQSTGENNGNRAKQSKSYVRSRSENLENPKVSSCGRLRRSETERFVGSVASEEKTRDLNDRMSNDELRYKIESFIARQRRNQKDEEFCII